MKKKMKKCKKMELSLDWVRVVAHLLQHANQFLLWLVLYK